ncbi:MAG: ABC transporter substrate-binding protein, partial [Candidatus Bathyarchaeia archaeon]
STGSDNDMRYNNPTVDNLLQQARSTTSTSDRIPLYQQAVRQISSDAPYIFLTAFPNGFVWKSNVKGFSPIPDGMVRTTEMYKT